MEKYIGNLHIRNVKFYVLQVVEENQNNRMLKGGGRGGLLCIEVTNSKKYNVTVKTRKLWNKEDVHHPIAKMYNFLLQRCAPSYCKDVHHPIAKKYGILLQRCTPSYCKEVRHPIAKMYTILLQRCRYY